MRSLLILLTTLTLMGCTTNPDVSMLTAEQRQKLSSIAVYKVAAPKNDYDILKSVKGLSCHRNAYKPVQYLSEDEALQGVKLNAAKLGADAVINTFCQNNSGTDWVNNCWGSIVCVGDAIKYTDGGR